MIFGPAVLPKTISNWRGDSLLLLFLAKRYARGWSSSARLLQGMGILQTRPAGRGGAEGMRFGLKPERSLRVWAKIGLGNQQPQSRNGSTRDVVS